jgi:hypothetical protein
VHDFGHLVVLHLSGVREDDQLAEQADGQQLQAEYRQQRSQQQGGTISQRLVEEHPLHHHEDDAHHA